MIINVKLYRWLTSFKEFILFGFEKLANDETNISNNSWLHESLNVICTTMILFMTISN